MNIAIIGTGYVGLVTGVCLSEESIGCNVTCIDVDKHKIDMLKTGTPTIYEDGLEELLKKNIAEGRLNFTTEFAPTIDNSDLVFVAVGTPEKDSGETDLKYILGVAEKVAQVATKDVYLVLKSTVPVGTADKVQEIFNNIVKDLGKDIKIFVSSNPEFLREGTAIYDFMNPDRIVIGTNDKRSKTLLSIVYYTFTKVRKIDTLYTDVASAQLIKYASNAFNACKITFINSLSQYCAAVDANIEDVALGMGLDKRIGKAFLKAGIGYGGSCFPKDVASLSYEITHKTPSHHKNALLEAIESENRRAGWWPIELLFDLFRPVANKDKKTITILGVAFKPGTDDVRHSPALDIIDEISFYYDIKVYDPIASHNAEKALNRDSEKYDEEITLENIKFCDSLQEAVKDSDALIFCTEWDEFKNLSEDDLTNIKSSMRGDIIIDGRNIFDRDKISKLFKYYCVGKKHIE